MFNGKKNDQDNKNFDYYTGCLKVNDQTLSVFSVNILCVEIRRKMLYI